MLEGATMVKLHHYLAIWWFCGCENRKSKEKHGGFAQMEGQENQKIYENGAPEVQKWCWVCILRFAAFENASHRFFVQSDVLQPEMVPQLYQNKSEIQFWKVRFSMRFLVRIS